MARIWNRRFYLRPVVALTPALGVVLAILATHGAGCGGGGGSSTPGSGTVTTNISDPAPQCTAPNGPYEHVWVTIAGVEAAISSDANAGFVNLTPNLSVTNPIQVDLLSAPNTECVLATLGQTSGLPPGKYEQIRLILVANNTPGVTLTPNQCVAAGSEVYNCVETAGTSSNYHPLDTPSASQTGIKIPPGQIANGGITVSAGQGVDIDIDFNACASVVTAGKSGKFILKPTLRASELGVNPLIAGTIVIGQSAGPGQPVTVPTPSSAYTVAGASVWLEQEPSAPNAALGTPAPASGATPTESVSQLVMATVSDANGNFEFCPVGPGTYDIVVDAPQLSSANPNPGGPTILSGVQVGPTGGASGLVIPLLPQPSPAATGTPLWAQMAGEVSTQNSPSTSGDFVRLNAAVSFTPGASATPVLAPVPLIVPPTGTPGGTLPPSGLVITSPSPDTTNCPSVSSVACPSGANCACFTLAVPASPPVVGLASQTNTTFTQSSSNTADFSLTAVALSMSTQQPVCSPSMLFANPVTVQGGGVVTPLGNIAGGVPALEFLGCD